MERVMSSEKAAKLFGRNKPKKHPHKRAIDKDTRKQLRRSGQAWWRQQDKQKKPGRRLSFINFWRRP